MFVSYHPAVADELIAVAEYYERIQPGLGYAFRDQYQHTIARIVAAPSRSGQIFPGIRGVPLRRFPYWVLYRVEADLIRIIVLRHRSRDIRYGLDRQ